MKSLVSWKRQASRNRRAPGESLSLLAVSPIADVGGAEVLLIDVLRGVQAAGHSVTLVILGDGALHELAQSEEIKVLGGPAVSFRRPVSVVRSAMHIRRVTKTVAPDIVHASHPRAGLLNRLALPGASAVHTTQLLEPPGSRDFIGRACLLLRGPHFVLTPAMAAAHTVSNRGLSPVVVAPGVDVERQRHRADAGDGERCWAALNDPGSAAGPRIVMVARLQPFKGPFDFVRTASLVLETRPDARFLIVGPDSSRSPGVRARLKAEIRQLGLQGKVCLSGPLEAEDLAATVHNSTMLVHPAHSEGFGLVIVEALALGTPVLAYASSGPAFILRHGGGSTVPVGDVEELARRLIKSLSEPEVLRRWRREAPEVAAAFDLSAAVRRYLSAFDSAVLGARSGRLSLLLPSVKRHQNGPPSS